MLHCGNSKNRMKVTRSVFSLIFTPQSYVKFIKTGNPLPPLRKFSLLHIETKLPLNNKTVLTFLFQTCIPYVKWIAVTSPKPSRIISIVLHTKHGNCYYCTTAMTAHLFSLPCEATWHERLNSMLQHRKRCTIQQYQIISTKTK